MNIIILYVEMNWIPYVSKARWAKENLPCGSVKLYRIPVQILSLNLCV